MTIYDPETDDDKFFEASSGFRHHQLLIPRVAFLLFNLMSLLVGAVLGMVLYLSNPPSRPPTIRPATISSPIVVPTCWLDTTSHSSGGEDETVTWRRVC